MESKGRNQTFNFLYVIAILMVIDDHTSSRIGFFTSIFPYNSFYMPMFVFASGYFYKKCSLLQNVKHKVKKLLIPYIICNIIAMGLAFIIDRIFNVNWVTIPTLKTIKEMFFSTSPTTLNGASWFVIMLFWVSISYNVIRQIFKENKPMDIILSIILISAAFVSIYLCTKGYANRGLKWIFILKIIFYVQFYHMGYMFKKYLEQWILKYSKLLVCSICILINVLLVLKYDYQINFYSTNSMGHFSIWFLPLITSITGILFYYEISNFLANKVGYVPLFDIIGRNTFAIMQVHLLFVNIPNFYIYHKISHGSVNYPDFDVTGFINGAWVRYNADARLMGFICGVIGSILICCIIEYLRKMYNKKRES